MTKDKTDSTDVVDNMPKVDEQDHDKTFKKTMNLTHYLDQCCSNGDIPKMVIPFPSTTLAA